MSSEPFPLINLDLHFLAFSRKIMSVTPIRFSGSINR